MVFVKGWGKGECLIIVYVKVEIMITQFQVFKMKSGLEIGTAM